MTSLNSSLKVLQILYPEQAWVKPYPVKLNGLPVWVKSAVRLFKIDLPGDRGVHLLYPKVSLPFEQLMQIHKILTERLEDYPLVIADKLPAKHRPLLVKFRIPFIYKDESIFAPALGVKFGKLNKMKMGLTIKVDEEKKALTPFGLKVVAGILTNQLPNEFTLKALFNIFQKRKVRLSLSKLSQTLNELAEKHLLVPHGSGPQKSYSCDKAIMWRKLLDTELSPLFREVQTNYIPKDLKTYTVSGESALSHYSNLAAPKQAVIAMAAGDFRRIYQQEKDIILYGDFASPIIVQVWKSDPRLFAIKGAMNPVELYFSLHANEDERVQMSLDEMLQRYNFKREG